MNMKRILASLVVVSVIGVLLACELPNGSFVPPVYSEDSTLDARVLDGAWLNRGEEAGKEVVLLAMFSAWDAHTSVGTVRGTRFGMDPGAGTVVKVWGYEEDGKQVVVFCPQFLHLLEEDLMPDPEQAKEFGVDEAELQRRLEAVREREGGIFFFTGSLVQKGDEMVIRFLGPPGDDEDAIALEDPEVPLHREKLKRWIADHIEKAGVEPFGQVLRFQRIGSEELRAVRKELESEE